MHGGQTVAVFEHILPMLFSIGTASLSARAALRRDIAFFMMGKSAGGAGIAGLKAVMR